LPSSWGISDTNVRPASDQIWHAVEPKVATRSGL